MKNTKLLTGLIVAGAMMVMFACKKEPGPGGDAHIEGEVEIEATSTLVPNAMVEIWYDATSKSSGSANAATTTDAGGKFAFEGLRKGDYYVGCMYTDTSGMMMEGGVAVKIDKKTGDFMADIHIE